MTTEADGVASLAADGSAFSTVAGSTWLTAVEVAWYSRVLTVGALPDAVVRMVPTSATDRRLPDVASVLGRYRVGQLGNGQHLRAAVIADDDGFHD